MEGCLFTHPVCHVFLQYSSVPTFQFSKNKMAKALTLTPPIEDPVSKRERTGISKVVLLFLFKKFYFRFARSFHYDHFNLPVRGKFHLDGP